ncbi:hypothetical protein EVAR_60266_1 [Eumeta japonica]|uniref:Uncharacterized protein n=1 Tax=Eumeta variegata TaxID=151549 RepID=A0A4C1Z3E1_EUMVA|nr:hypothetical protein EVAR_60266_1 [Eumeta japonica]
MLLCCHRIRFDNLTDDVREIKNNITKEKKTDRISTLGSEHRDDSSGARTSFVPHRAPVLPTAAVKPFTGPSVVSEAIISQEERARNLKTALELRRKAHKFLGLKFLTILLQNRPVAYDSYKAHEERSESTELSLMKERVESHTVCDYHQATTRPRRDVPVWSAKTTSEHGPGVAVEKIGIQKKNHRNGNSEFAVCDGNNPAERRKQDGGGRKWTGPLPAAAATWYRVPKELIHLLLTSKYAVSKQFRWANENSSHQEIGWSPSTSMRAIKKLGTPSSTVVARHSRGVTSPLPASWAGTKYLTQTWSELTEGGPLLSKLNYLSDLTARSSRTTTRRVVFMETLITRRRRFCGRAVPEFRPIEFYTLSPSESVCYVTALGGGYLTVLRNGMAK